MGLKCFDWLFGKKANQLAKLKILLSLTVSRIDLHRIQRLSRCTQAQADVAHFLILGHRDRALLRTEMVIKERNMLDVLAMVESYCYILTERVFLLQNQKDCPEELREAAAGLAFAASRCGDLPELRDVRQIFASRFGKEFTTAAAELRNNCGVSCKMVQKFSTRLPSLETRAKVARDIAIEKGIKVELVGPIPDSSEIYLNPKLRSKNHTKTPSEPPMHACDIHELVIDEKVATMAQPKYSDAISASLAAFESATHAAAAAKAALELYRTESQRRDIYNPKKNNPIDDADYDQSPSNSCCSSIDLGCRPIKVSSEMPKGKEILTDDIHECDEDEEDEEEELARLSSMVLVPLSRSHSFVGDLEVRSQLKEGRSNGGRSSVNGDTGKMAIIAVDPSKKKKKKNEGKKLNVRKSMANANSFSVRTRR